MNRFNPQPKQLAQTRTDLIPNRTGQNPKPSNSQPNQINVHYRSEPQFTPTELYTPNLNNATCTRKTCLYILRIKSTLRRQHKFYSRNNNGLTRSILTSTEIVNS